MKLKSLAIKCVIKWVKTSLAMNSARKRQRAEPWRVASLVL